VPKSAKYQRRWLGDIRAVRGTSHERKLTMSELQELRRRLFAGEDFRAVAKVYGYNWRSMARIIRRTGGCLPRVRQRSPLRLSLCEREEISRGIGLEESCRSIARRLGRAPSTVSREIASKGKRREYRAWWGDELAMRWARRPKPGRLASPGRLRDEVRAC
jgi:IS30 family transposase